MTDTVSRQSVIDEEHLALLSIGYMISGGFNALFSLFGLFYVLIGILVATFPAASNSTPKPGQMPAAFGLIFAGIGLFFMAVLVTFAILKFRAASCLKQRKSRTFCMVVAGFTCLEFPYGTALGVWTFMTLGRESVVRLFDSNTAAQPVP